MSIKRYVAEKDTTIASAYLPNLVDKSENANIGAADSLEMFSLYGQVSPNSIEKSRILIQFPVQDIINDRTKSLVPQSGSVKFFLRVFNVEHPFSLPKDYKSTISVVSQSWDEGYGLDMENYTDYGWGTGNKGSGATWVYATSGTLWSQIGGAFYDSLSEYNFDYEFKSGTEDIEIDVTNVVEDWISSKISNNGFVIKLSSSFEDGTYKNSFYTKKFSARTSEYFYKKPIIEARWETVSTDDRNIFYSESPALSLDDNKMSIYYYNSVNGMNKNIVGDVIPGVKFYADSSLTNEITASYLNVTNPLAGIYKAQVVINTTASILYDKWYNTSSTATYYSDYIDINTRGGNNSDINLEYIVSITNNKLVYSDKETAKFNIFVRERDWQPTIYSKAYNTIENTIISDLYYKIFRLNDNYVVLDYSTGSIPYTKTSYDSNGNYFELDMSILEKNYNYGIKLARWNGSELTEFPTTFKFKVE